MEIVGLLTQEPLARLAIKNKIKNFITPDLYRDLEDFIKDNPTFEDFKRRAKFNDSYKRALNWGSDNISEEEYQQIPDVLIRLEDGTGLKIEGWLDFCNIECVDSKNQPLKISFKDLKKGLHNKEDE